VSHSRSAKALWQKFQIPIPKPQAKFQFPNWPKSYAHHSLPAFCYLNLDVTWDLAAWDLEIATPTAPTLDFSRAVH
jgi:hypothetical protein